jgi:hypothetical protein
MSDRETGLAAADDHDFAVFAAVIHPVARICSISVAHCLTPIEGLRSPLPRRSGRSWA